MNKMKLLFTLAIPVFTYQAAHAQPSRLTARANWVHNGAEFKRSDSTAYNYLSTSRGGDLNNMLKFDDATNWSFVVGDTQNNNMRYVQEFDANNNLTTRVVQQWDGTLMTWANQWKYVYSYNADNKKTAMVTQHWDGTSAWITDAKNVYSYNAANQMYLDQYQVWDGTMYTPSSQTIYYFDGSGNTINETNQMFVAGTPVFTTQVNYTYTATNKLLSESHANWNGAAWDNTNMMSYTYDSSDRRTTELHQTWDGAAYVNDMLRLFSNFSDGNPQTEINQTWDTTGTGSWVDMYQFAYAYNSNGQMTTSTRQSYDISIGWVNAFGDTRSNYYYGTFVSVRNVSATEGDAKFFPVPAANLLNVDVNWKNAQAATITVADLQGRILKTIEMAAAVSQHVSIPVGDMANGIYVVNIAGMSGNIVKQIVVAH